MEEFTNKRFKIVIAGIVFVNTVLIIVLVVYLVALRGDNNNTADNDNNDNASATAEQQPVISNQQLVTPEQQPQGSDSSVAPLTVDEYLVWCSGDNLQSILLLDSDLLSAILSNSTGLSLDSIGVDGITYGQVASIYKAFYDVYNDSAVVPPPELEEYHDIFKILTLAFYNFAQEQDPDMIFDTSNEEEFANLLLSSESDVFSEIIRSGIRMSQWEENTDQELKDQVESICVF